MYGFKCSVIIILIFLLNNTNGIKRSSGGVHRLSKTLEEEKRILAQKCNQYNSQRHQLNERKRQVQQTVDPMELIRLNVGGQIIVTYRATLIKVPNSILARSFDGTYQAVIPRDHDGSYFLDYNPVLFTHLLDQLRTLENNKTIVFRPPLSSPSKPFNQMLRDFGLPLPPKSKNDVIPLNVGGEKIVTLRKTLTGIPNSNLARLASNSKKVNRDRIGRPFLDYDAILFRHLLDQLRKGKKNQ